MALKTFSTHPADSPLAPSPATTSRRAALIGVPLAVLVALAGGGWYAYSQDQAARVAPGVQAGDVPLGGLTVAEAEAAITTRYATLNEKPVVLRAGTRSWSFPAQSLGIRLDTAATARAAKAAGQPNNAAVQVPLVLTHERSAADKTWQPLAGELAVAPTDAKFHVDADGVQVYPAIEGRRFDPDGTWKALQAATQTDQFAEVPVAVAAVQPAITDASVAPALATIHRLTDAPVVLHGMMPDGSSHDWTVEPAQLRTWLQVSQDAAGVPNVATSLDPDGLKAYLNGIAADVKRDPVNAKLSLPNYATSAALAPDVAGQQLNMDEALTALQTAAAADADHRQASLVLDPVPATITATGLQPLKDQLDATMRDGLTLHSAAGDYVLKGSKAALALYVEPTNDGSSPGYKITVNDNDVGRLVAIIAKDLARPAQNAAYRLVNNTPTLVKQPQDGLRVDSSAAATILKDALQSGQREATLPTQPVKPTYASTDLAASITTPDLLQSDITSYAGSSPERNWNVTYGATKLDGWLVPPGGTFSASDALGDLTVEAGFKMGWAILVQNGNATTIPSEAGGICQVVTTLFHPVFWAGLPIVERHNHSYWIATYGRPPLGMQGLDATVSPPDYDFRFKNTTGNWLLIRAHGDKSNLRVEVWGTNPHWTVNVSKPVITKVVKTDQTPRFETTDKLEAGRRVQVEHAQDGFSSDIHREVYDATGTKLDDWHAISRYLPSHNTWMTGTGTAR